MAKLSAMGWLAAAVFVLLAAVTAAFGLPVGLRRVLVCGLGVPAGALTALTAQSVGLVPGSAAPAVLGVVLAVAFAALGAVVPRRALTAIVAVAGGSSRRSGHPGVDLRRREERGPHHRPDRRTRRAA